MRILLIAALFAAGPAIAAKEMVARSGDSEVRIFDAPCMYASVLRHIPEQNRKQFRKATAQIGKDRYFACYVITQGGAYLVYEDGDNGFVPGGDFKESHGI